MVATEELSDQTEAGTQITKQGAGTVRRSLLQKQEISDIYLRPTTYLSVKTYVEIFQHKTLLNLVAVRDL